MFNRITLLVTLVSLSSLLLAPILANSAAEVHSLDNLNSTFLSHLRFKLQKLDLDDEQNECILYCKSISNYLSSSAAKDGNSEQQQGTTIELLLPQSQQSNLLDKVDKVDVDLLVRVSNLLKSRHTVYGPSSLAEFTDNCIEKLNNSRNSGGEVIDDSETKPVVELKIDNNFNETTELEIEEENAELKKSLALLKSELEIKLKSFIEFKSKQKQLWIAQNKVVEKVSKDLIKAQEEVKQLKQKLEERIITSNQCNVIPKPGEEKESSKHVDVDHYKSELRDKKEELKSCQKELKEVVKKNSVTTEANCWSDLEELKNHALREHSLVKKLKQEKSECKHEMMGFKEKAHQFDRVTKKVLKELRKGYEVECKQWKVKDHGHDEEDSDSDSDDDNEEEEDDDDDDDDHHHHHHNHKRSFYIYESK